jgi:hypothetical protein
MRLCETLICRREQSLQKEMRLAGGSQLGSVAAAATLMSQSQTLFKLNFDELRVLRRLLPFYFFYFAMEAADVLGCHKAGLPPTSPLLPSSAYLKSFRRSRDALPQS